jgi:hypothetical protein
MRNVFVTPKYVPGDNPKDHKFYANKPLVRVSAEMASVSDWMAVFHLEFVRDFFKHSILQATPQKIMAKV